MESENPGESKQQATSHSHTPDTVDCHRPRDSAYANADGLQCTPAGPATGGPGWTVAEEVLESAFLAFRYSSGYAFEGNH